ncbi:rCG29872 [Rattus norvegicus]|uniref:RCG29872 n=1 Tax=Rattus norvegicus TaxID=10116 RepID=A6IN45_RAT|nr:rCG29872 [Rattus norvegicus]
MELTVYRIQRLNCEANFPLETHLFVTTFPVHQIEHFLTSSVLLYVTHIKITLYQRLDFVQ